MKDGRTHLAYKAEHAVDLDSDLVLSASIYRADHSDIDSLAVTLDDAGDHLRAIGSEAQIRDAVADKGYHGAGTLADCEARGIRTYIPERSDRRRRRWTDKPEAWKEAFCRNRRRVRGARSPVLQRRRSEVVERTFAHSCGSARGRRTHLRGLYDVGKRWLVHLAGRNLGVMIRELNGFGTPRSLQRAGKDAGALAARGLLVLGDWLRFWAAFRRPISTGC